MTGLIPSAICFSRKTAALALMLCLTGLVMSGEAQAERFVDNGNGTVTDTVTGLMWTKDANPLGNLNRPEALPRIRSFSISGIGGWRLPSREELVALYHAIQGGHPFTGVRDSYYLSGTGMFDNRFIGAVAAVIVSMGSGHVSAISHFDIHRFHVWPVR
jgi:hypothetical protein